MSTCISFILLCLHCIFAWRTFDAGAPPRLRARFTHSTLDELWTTVRPDVSLQSITGKSELGSNWRFILPLSTMTAPLLIPRLAPPRPYKNELIAAAGGQHTFSHHRSSSPTLHQPPRRIRPVHRCKNWLILMKRLHYAPFCFVFILGNKLQLQDRSKGIFHFCRRYFRL
jgi:hypothetical protein